MSTSGIDSCVLRDCRRRRSRNVAREDRKGRRHCLFFERVPRSEGGQEPDALLILLHRQPRWVSAGTRSTPAIGLSSRVPRLYRQAGRTRTTSWSWPTLRVAIAKLPGRNAYVAGAFRCTKSAPSSIDPCRSILDDSEPDGASKYLLPRACMPTLMTMWHRTLVQRHSDRQPRVFGHGTAPEGDLLKHAIMHMFRGAPTGL